MPYDIQVSQSQPRGPFSLPLVNGTIEPDVDDKHMTKMGNHIHALVIFPGDTETVFSGRGNERGPLMGQTPPCQQPSNLGIIPVLPVQYQAGLREPAGSAARRGLRR